MVKRQNDGCANNGVSCSSLGADGVCCPEDTICATDAAGRIGCCPLNAVCTGIVSGAQVTASGTTQQQQSGTSATSGQTRTTGFVLGGTTTVTSTAGGGGGQSGGLQIPTTGVQGGGSTVQANGFVFTYIPTSYANSQLCETAFSVCQQQSSACLSSLGGANGVTVGGFGAGTTVQGGGSTVTNAAGVCSSLSAQACYNLEEEQCTNFGPNGGGSSGGTTVIQPGNDGPRQTACAGVLYAAGAGAVYGAMRGMV